MPLLSAAKKAEQFAKLLDGSASAGSGELGHAAEPRQPAVLGPPAPARVRQRPPRAADVGAATTLPSAAGAAGAGAGSGGAGSSGLAPAGRHRRRCLSAGSGGRFDRTATGASTASPVPLLPVRARCRSAATSAASSVLAATAPLWASWPRRGRAAIAVDRGRRRRLPLPARRPALRRQAAGRSGAAGPRRGRRTRRSPTSASPAPASTRCPACWTSNGRHAAVGRAEKRIRTLLTEWADETSRGTTVLLDQLSAGATGTRRAAPAAHRLHRQPGPWLALVVQRLPDTTLQSLTGSAFAYLQRVDTALGNPVDLARLLPSSGSPCRRRPRTAPRRRAATPTAPDAAAGRPASGSPTGRHRRPCRRCRSPPAGDAVRRARPHGAVPAVAPDPRHGEHRRLPGRSAAPSAAPPERRRGRERSDQDRRRGPRGVTGNGPSLPLPTTVPTCRPCPLAPLTAQRG